MVLRCKLFLPSNKTPIQNICEQRVQIVEVKEDLRSGERMHLWIFEFAPYFPQQSMYGS